MLKPAVLLVQAVMFITVSLAFQKVYGSSESVKIGITTQYHDDVILNAFNIRCTPQMYISCANSIVSIQVIKGDDNGKTLVNVQGGDTIVYDRLLQSSVKAEGHIDRDFNKSFLSVTVTEAVNEDSGMYTCKMLYLDESIQFQFVTATDTIEITKQDTQDIIKHLMSQVSSMENQMQNQQNELSNTKTALEEQVTNLERELEVQKNDSDARISTLTDQLNAQELSLQHIMDKDNTTVSFVALHPRTGVFQSGMTVVYSQVLVNEGRAYNGSTGVFTAPVRGFYLLHISVTSPKEQHIILDLKNGKNQNLTRLDAYNKEWTDFADASCVVRLETGERVRPVTRYVSPGYDSFYGLDTQDYANKFYGFLLKPL